MNKNTKQMDNAASAVGHKGIISAVVTAIYDRFSNKGVISPLRGDERLDGKVCLITGANSGLGKAVAIDVAKRGAKVIMACRSGIPEAGEEVKRLSGNSSVEMLRVDLSDMTSVNKLCDQLRDRNVVLDLAIMNAGLMPLNARKSAQGYELMFAVHFLSNRLLMERLMSDGVIKAAGKGKSAPRVIFVASEAHKSSDPIDFEHFGEFVNYGMKDGMKHYGMTKLMLCTFATELSRRINGIGDTRISISALCPGPIASNIARESPAFIKPILGPIMKLFFRSPEQAAEPVVYLACSKKMEGRTGVYLHMMREKSMSPEALNAANGKLLWQKSEQLLRPFLLKATEPA